MTFILYLYPKILLQPYGKLFYCFNAMLNHGIVNIYTINSMEIFRMLAEVVINI